jgi:hypothetical protein
MHMFVLWCIGFCTVEGLPWFLRYNLLVQGTPVKESSSPISLPARGGAVLPRPGGVRNPSLRDPLQPPTFISPLPI